MYFNLLQVKNCIFCFITEFVIQILTYHAIFAKCLLRMATYFKPYLQ